EEIIKVFSQNGIITTLVGSYYLPVLKEDFASHY
ncbi:hypothetical protein HKBW3S43_01886, partial [Candidatus Hakubella thermalkaliphila]